MAKFKTKIGFAVQVKVSPGVWEEDITEYDYYGELLRNSRRLQPGDQVLDNVNISNEVSIVSDPFARTNFHAIRYAEFMGAKWKVSDVEVRYPRLILTIGGLYNGKQA